VGLSKIVTRAKPERTAGEPNSKSGWILNVHAMLIQNTKEFL